MAPTYKKKLPWFSSQKFNNSKTIDKSYSNWMKNIKDELNIIDIAIPGTHNSATEAIEYVKFINFFINWNIKTQSWSILEQLLSGIRYFDIRPGKNGIIYHGIFKTNLTFDYITNIMCNFLDENSSEGIIMRIQFQSMNSKKAKVIFPIFEKYSKYFMFSNNIPLVKDIRKKIYVITERFTYNNSLDIWDEKIFMQDYFKLIGFRPLVIKKKKKLAIECLGMKNSKKLLLNHFSGIGWRIFSTTKYIAFRINEVLYNSNNYKGIMIMDYPSEYIIKKVIDQNFIYNL